MQPFGCGLASRHLEQSRGTHAAADAHRHNDEFRAAALALDQRVADHASAGHAVWMPDRNGTAVDVEFIVSECPGDRGNTAPDRRTPR